MIKKIGFISNLYHSEVIEYLFNLYENEDVNFIWYMDKDWHGNNEIYKSRYKNRLEIKNMIQYTHDIKNNVCKLFYFAEFHILLNVKNTPDLLKDKIILICHSKEQCDIAKKYNMKYITLTPLLCDNMNINYTIPVTYNDSIDLQEIEKEQYKKRKNNKNIKVAMIGYFSHGRDIQRIKELVKSDIDFYIFTRCITQELHNFYNNYINNNIYLMINLPTKKILDIIKNLNIECIMLLPLDSCSIYSGSINFAYNNYIPLLTTQKVIDIYNLKGALNIDNKEILKRYKTGETITSLINEINDYKKINFSRNSIVKYLIEMEYSLNLEIETFDNKKIKNEEGITICIGIGDGINILKLMCYIKGNFILIEKDIVKAISIKKILLELNTINRCIIYNNIVGDSDIKNYLENIDAICLDSIAKNVSNKKIDNIYINNNNHKDILEGAKKIIQRGNPTIIIKKKTKQ